MDEEIFYADENVKITGLRITANHITIPIGKIEKSMVGFKAARMAVSFGIFLLSIILVWAGCKFYSHCCLFGILFVIVCLAYFINVCRSYVELKMSTTGSKPFALTDSSLNNSERIFQIAEALDVAFERRRTEEMNA